MLGDPIIMISRIERNILRAAVCALSVTILSAYEPPTDNRLAGPIGIDRARPMPTASYSRPLAAVGHSHKAQASARSLLSGRFLVLGVGF